MTLVQALCDDYLGTSISTSLRTLLAELDQNLEHTFGEKTTKAQVMHRDGTPRFVSASELAWISEDMELIHAATDPASPQERAVGKDFLRGFTVSWADLENHYDAERDKTQHFLKLVENELVSRQTSRVNLLHSPGAGGTTVARKIAWDLRQSYPVVVLHSVVTGETIERFRKLFQLTSQPILAVVETGDVMHEVVDRLYDEAKTEHIPIVFLSVLRTFTPAQSTTERTVFLGEDLSVPEGRRFVEAYKRVVPQKGTALEAILLERDIRTRTPFQFALTAFERDFVGISSYVQSRLKNATTDQRDILVFLALAYYYGHQPLFPQLLAGHLAQPRNRKVPLDGFLAEPQRELMVEEEDGRWRPRHYLIAEAILESFLGGSVGNIANWRTELAPWAVRFIDMCRAASAPSDSEPLTDVLELLHRTFIFRDDRDLLGTETASQSKYARCIEDIPTIEGRLLVFQKLVDSFPDVAHFHAHLGRYCSMTMGDYRRALSEISKAIDLSPNDGVLYHIQGMCYRRMAESNMKDIRAHYSYASTQEWNRDELVDLVNNAKSAFQQARLLDLDSEHGYISAIQLLLDTLDFGFVISHKGSRSEFLTAPTSAWYRDQLDELETLMEQAQRLRQGDRPSRYLEECRARLDQVYGDYSRALEGWRNLLDRRDVYAPPIRRQIARAYWIRRNRRWKMLSVKEVDNIVSLMEENLLQEPGSEHNIRLWFSAFRYSRQQDIDLSLVRLASWRAAGDSVDAYYYQYILHVMKALDGFTLEADRAQDLIKSMKERARNLRNRTRAFDWWGRGEGLERLVHSDELGEWDSTTDFYSNTALLAPLDGRIAKIDRPESGTLELAHGLSAFFTPARGNFAKGRDENIRVSFFLGFSYDGLRAWEVHRVVEHEE